MLIHSTFKFFLSGPILFSQWASSATFFFSRCYERLIYYLAFCGEGILLHVLFAETLLACSEMFQTRPGHWETSQVDSGMTHPIWSFEHLLEPTAEIPGPGKGSRVQVPKCGFSVPAPSLGQNISSLEMSTTP